MRRLFLNILDEIALASCRELVGYKIGVARFLREGKVDKNYFLLIKFLLIQTWKAALT